MARAARNYLILLIFIGMFTSMLGSCFSRPSQQTAVPRISPMTTVSAEPQKFDSTSPASSGEVELKRSDDGHFYADVQINGATIHALVDTGATGIGLSRDDARRAGIATSIGMTDVIGKGADGDVRGEYVTLDRITLGDKTVEHMEAVVFNSGELTLLGQTFLAKFASVEIKGDTMVLR